jgi:peptidoglycan/xylan/chitin deacetylase (PgdA/CDA1 family)
MSLIHKLQTIPLQKILLPFYHTVAERPLPHIKNLYRMKTVAEFQKDLDFLLKHFEPIDVDTLFHLMRNKKVPKNPVFHVTFDDGLKEMYDIVAPILLKKGVPATFFVNSGFVNNKELFYRHHACLAVEYCKDKQNKCTIDEILLCSYRDRDKLFHYYSQQQVDDFLKNEKPYLTTEQIQTLSRQGFTIGAHSIDHPYYDQIPLPEQLRQPKNSLDCVASTVNQKLRLFAFPFTDCNVTKDFFNEIKPYVDISFGTAGLKKDAIPYHLQRIGVEKGSAESLKSVLRKELVKYIVKIFMGRNVVYRK